MFTGEKSSFSITHCATGNSVARFCDFSRDGRGRSVDCATGRFLKNPISGTHAAKCPVQADFGRGVLVSFRVLQELGKDRGDDL